MGVAPLLGDMIQRTWDIQSGTIEAKSLSGWATLNREVVNLDLYVCGFMCTPFTPNGRRAVGREGRGAGRSIVQFETEGPNGGRQTSPRASHRASLPSRPLGMGWRRFRNFLGLCENHCHTPAPLFRAGERDSDF